MSILASLFGGTTVQGVGEVVDKIFTSDEERLQAQAVLAKIKNHLPGLQAEINKIQAGHSSLFVAGARPSIMWVCSIGLFYQFLLQPILTSVGLHAPVIDTSSMHDLIVALLGFGAYRSYEKIKGVARNKI